MQPQYVAMWSGPRNISTAMMRSWGSRADTTVVDEPFYAHYLQQTGLDHPGANDVIASQATDWRQVVTSITGGIPDNKSIYYQKHITTHMLDSIALDWLAPLSHCFLIRAPQKVVSSYNRQRPTGAALDLGYQQQDRIYRHVCEYLDSTPVVIDSDLFLRNPAAQLQAVCQHLQIEYTDAMLSWPPGIRKTDGVWHPWWYDAVANSTGFNPWQEKELNLTEVQLAIADECEPYYANMRSRALITEGSSH